MHIQCKSEFTPKINLKQFVESFYNGGVTRKKFLHKVYKSFEL